MTKAFTILVALVLFAGCTPKNYADVQRAQGRLEERLLSIASNAELVKPHVEPIGLQFIQQIGEDARLAAKDAALINESYTALTEKNEKILSNRWVRVALWTQKMFWLVVVTWVVVGVGSVALGVGNPMGWTWKIGVFLRRLMPFSNIFGWTNDKLHGKSASNPGS
jgi:hypothetical protein